LGKLPRGAGPSLWKARKKVTGFSGENLLEGNKKIFRRTGLQFSAGGHCTISREESTITDDRPGPAGRKGPQFLKL